MISVVGAVATAEEAPYPFSILALMCAIGLAIVHIFAGHLRFLDVTPRSRWLSFSSGVSVAYIFIHVLPELNQGQETISNAIDDNIAIAYIEHHVYLIALLGLAIFYGLERLAETSRQRNEEAGKGDVTEAGVFWVHISSFAVYNALIGYLLLHREEPGTLSLVLFFIAMALHFIVNDYGLREHHKSSYKHIGRWLLAASILFGWVLGNSTEISEAAIAVLFAFIAGGVVLNVLKEELPEERESRFLAFAIGSASYAALLLAV